MFGGHARARTIIAAKPRSLSTAPPAKPTNSTCAPTTTAWRCARGWRPSRAGKSTARRRNGNCPAIRWRGIRRILSITRGLSRARRLEDLRADESIALPITFTLPGGGYALVTEANLLNYSDAAVRVAANHSLRVYFHADRTERLDDRRRRGSAVARHAAGPRPERAGEQRPHSQSLPARAHRNWPRPTGSSPAAPRGNGGPSASPYSPTSISGWIGRRTSVSSITSWTRAGKTGRTTAATTGPA